ncbi:RNA repair transcriptional activator RtcR [Haliangium ochraceum]|uniref:Sigma 54 interacting domain protein n=1 Tax=Haliangium ochraceum (strain DSM 14365 / JCM 11303 / SMP-2) TaxID=502025 RepID=D0LHL3_HALO1|nr:RNA repair transcriptional activator RtcR [Haliangium ochraceum]ACY12875.1 Sigma 54 interacting domain protein [Haliangium ochraceum DSM 14365]
MRSSGKRLVVIGLLGSTLDRGGRGARRWDKWRPSVALCRHEDLLVDRLELLHMPAHQRLLHTVRGDIAQVSPETEVRPHALDLRDAWDFEEVFAALHEFARAYEFRPDSEDYLVHITTGTHVAQICLFLLTESRHLPARLLQTSPPGPEHRGEPGRYAIIDLDLSRYDRLASRFRQEQQDRVSFLKSGIDTRSPAFNALIERVERVALRSRAPILLSGPTGAGKSQLARQIYELRRARRQLEGAFVEVNCATLRGDAAMSALFGHVRGAYTGASRDRAGLLRQADRGMLFLDEIGELGGDEQAMLLRAIEDKRFVPVGGDREAASDFQLIAGSNRDLERAVAQGRFREDLLARIDTWWFRLPALRERPEDIEPNLDYELAQWTQRQGTRVTFNREARARFLHFASGEATWPGNFRDFNAAITRMATLASGGRITIADVDDELSRLRARWQHAIPAASPQPPPSPPTPDHPSENHTVSENASIDRSSPEHAQQTTNPSWPRARAALGDEALAALDRFERAQLEDVLGVCALSDSLSEAGRALFAVSRARKQRPNDADRLRKYLARHGLSWSQLSTER